MPVSASLIEASHKMSPLTRAIVVFKNNQALVWQSEDSDAVYKWARGWDLDEGENNRRVSKENGGVFHTVAYTVKTGFVIYETEH